MQELVDALVARLPPEALRPVTAVRAIRRSADGYAIEAGAETVSADAVVVALPARHAAPLVLPLLPEAGAVLHGIRFASTATLLMGFRREDVGHPLDGFGLVVARSEGLRTTALTFVSTKLPERAPDGHVLLRAFLGGVLDPGVLELDDAALLALVQNEMRGVMGLRGAPVLARVYRWPEATPQMEIGQLARVAELDARLASHPTLRLIGAGLRVTGIPDCVAEGRAAAASLASVLSAA
jgi:oxygen-dependent protoporphyrinogen oxidase